jgi:Thrombospondin type 3 repeat
MRRPFLALIGLALTVLAAVWASPRDSGATTFAPFFGPSDFYTLNPTTPGAYSDHRIQFNILAPSSVQSTEFGGSIVFGDSDITIASSSGIPNVGAYVGETSGVFHMSLGNDGCGSQVPMMFNLVEANTDPSARSITNGGQMTLSTAVTDSATTIIYAHPLDPMGVRSDGLPLNEIRIDSEEMLITGVNTATNTYIVVRGWNGTTPAAHAAGTQIRRVNVLFPAGPVNRLLANLAEDDGDLDNNGTAEFSEFAGNQIPDGADSVPGFIRDSLDPNRNADDGGALQAHARYQGIAYRAPVIIPLQLVVMSPGTPAVLPNLDWATSVWGYPTAMFVLDPVGPHSNSLPGQGNSEFCNFTSNTTLFGIPHDNACTTPLTPPSGCLGDAHGILIRLGVDGGCPGASTPNECGTACSTGCPPPCDPGTCYRSKNTPTAQPTRFYQYVVSQRDYDNDGHENYLDTCHSDPNPNWDPRASNVLSGGDNDGDGLPAICGDSNDASSNSDEDSDLWQNRHDSCPAVANATPGGGAGIAPNTLQWDQDVPLGQPVPDGGPHADDIAPACDIASESCAGCPALTPTGANGHYHATAAAQTICIGTGTAECNSAPTADADGDGVVNARDTCINGANLPFVFPGPNGADTLTVNANASTTTIAVDSTLGFTQGSPIVIGDPLESLRYIVGSPTATTISFTPALTNAHQVGDPVAQVSHAQSLRDLNNDGFSDISDISLLTGVFGSQGGDPANDGAGDDGVPGYQGRYDLNYDSFVDISDISHMTGVFGATCGPPP